ncbi:protein of unknown function DUF1656 [Methylobacterium sp. 4-46]|uniref:DUF1656 domain-containing protein n=1 Tax=unclassified Methylobacterium TaxID=2615210 RepID=UPI000152D16F|nr:MULTISPECIES: DUF1656 domain-containing protein [Methylobacterium]ACA19194.1 protein of unknown function DUF1656 [Methylobacterium sp. 4-46]WFT78402.1 DUF1656 domain-containing protein [Methylobacterium nodulans]
MPDLDLYGVFLPALLVQAVIAFALSLVLRHLIARAGLYRLVWHRPLFDAALTVTCLGAVVALAPRFA